MKKIGILGAQDYEVSLLSKSLTESRTETANGIVFHIGKLNNLEAIVVRSGEGKVNAAITTTLLISRYAPDAIVNTGCMGALNPELNVFDIVVSSSAVEHDMDYGVLGHAPGTVFLPDGSTMVEMNADTGLASGLLTAARNRGCNVHIGKIASGDRFVCTDAEKKRIRETFNADGCEMEGAAVAHVCTIAKVPFGIIRAVSDSANGDAGMSYAEFSRKVSEISASILVEFANMLS